MKGCLGNSRFMLNFGIFTDLAKVIGILLQGMMFTWSNNREAESWVRLDRFLCDHVFLSWFPNMFQKGLCMSLFYHNPIVIGKDRDNWGPKPFRFANIWLEDKQLMEGVHNSWRSCKDGGSVGSKLFQKSNAAKKFLKVSLKLKIPQDKLLKKAEGDLDEIERKVSNLGVVD
ncbi:hypothetical protein Ddye_005705 [Dipteronia dyeriana]|uniref:Uncharacterized protein n=1 Tax=Dipteronia dyeriana TaxID=168575 RepID=A0AAE0CPY6_9ROSI|nr:hypothetical protein Ddye_005705 [Dipteronia dyeriana]